MQKGYKKTKAHVTNGGRVLTRERIITTIMDPVEWGISDEGKILRIYLKPPYPTYHNFL